MTNTTPFLQRRVRRLGLLAALAALAGAAPAATFDTSIELRALDGTLAPGGQAALNTPLSRSLVSAANPGLKGSAAVDLGVLRVSASAPAWDGASAEPYSYYQAKASASYTDTLTFTHASGGYVPVSFTFAFDGHVQDPSNAHRAGVDLSMTLSGAADSIGTAPIRDLYFRDGLADPFAANFPSFGSCRAGAAEYGQAPLICQQSSSFSFSSSGDKAGTATFNFFVASGQAVKVQTLMTAWGYSDPYIATAVTYDFSHTATLSSVTALLPGTQITSALVGDLAAAPGGVTYAPAIAAAVPEPAAPLLLLAGLATVGYLAARRRRTPV